jgi:hypothetical protein
MFPARLGAKVREMLVRELTIVVVMPKLFRCSFAMVSKYIVESWCRFCGYSE